MKEWLSDFNNWVSIITILGFLLTCYLLLEIRKIKKSFLRKARLPEIVRELSKLTSQLFRSLTNWENDKNKSLEIFSKIKAFLENVKPKLPAEEHKQVEQYLKSLKPKRYNLFKRSLSDLTEDEIWERYTELSGLITSLQQLNKDSKWD